MSWRFYSVMMWMRRGGFSKGWKITLKFNKIAIKIKQKDFNIKKIKKLIK